MSSRCSSSTCLNGNCQGCKNGSKFCNDPRCYPNCPDCSGETNLECLGGRNGWDWTLIIIIGVLTLLVLILFASMGWGKNSTKPAAATEMYQPVNYQVPPPNYAYNQPPQVEVTTKPAPAAYPNPGYNPGYNPNPVYNANLDASLNVSEPVYQASNPITQASFTTSIPNVPVASIPSPANVSVASARTFPRQVNPVNQGNGMINGFNQR